MTPRKEDILIRKDNILSIAISKYIESVTPVSSRYIADNSYLDISSATIRNILAELEHDGFLTHPHTSAGRIPTQKGYRYYVDNLMDEINILEEEKRRIKKEYKLASNELESLLECVSRALSETTTYTSIISVDGWDNKMYYCGSSSVVNYPDSNDILKIKMILSALEEKEDLLKVINENIEDRINILIGSEISCESVDSCSLVISKYKMKNGPTGKIAILGPTRMHYDKVVSTLDYVSEMMQEVF